MSDDRYSTNNGWTGPQNNGKYYSNMNNYSKSIHYANSSQPNGSHSHGKHQKFDLQVGNLQGDFARNNQYHGHHNNYSVNHHASNSYGKYYDRYSSGTPNIPYQGRGGYYNSRGGFSGRYVGKSYHYPYTQQQQQQQQQQSHQQHSQHEQQVSASQIFSNPYEPSNVAAVPQAASSATSSTSPPMQPASYNYPASGNSLYNYHSDLPLASTVPVSSNVEIVSDDDHLKSSRIWAKLLKVTAADDPKGLDTFDVPSYRESSFVKKFRKDLDDLDEINKKIRDHEIIKVNNEIQFDNWTRIEKTTNLIYDLNNKKLEEMVNNEW